MNRHPRWLTFALSFLAVCAIAAGIALLATGSPTTTTTTSTTSSLGVAGPVGASNFGVLAPGETAPAASSAPTTLMFDDVDLTLIPKAAKAVAGYVKPSSYPTFTSLRSMWPKAKLISITPSASVIAKCLDVEPGDATPPQVYGWLIRALKVIFRPCIYSSISEWSEITPYLTKIKRSLYLKWDAWYTGTAHLDAGFDATQYTDRCQNVSLDCSRVDKAFLTLTKPKPVISAKRKAEATIEANHKIALGLKAQIKSDRSRFLKLVKANNKLKKEYKIK